MVFEVKRWDGLESQLETAPGFQASVPNSRDIVTLQSEALPGSKAISMASAYRPEQPLSRDDPPGLPENVK
jgi:hypothetical protein